MQSFARNLSECRRLLRSEKSIETVGALVIFGITVGPVMYKIWKVQKEVYR